MREEIDVTGLSRMVVTDFKDTDLKPRIEIKEDGKTHNRYFLPASAYIMVQEGSDIRIGDVIAKIPRETTKTKSELVILIQPIVVEDDSWHREIERTQRRMERERYAPSARRLLKNDGWTIAP